MKYYLLLFFFSCSAMSYAQDSLTILGQDYSGYVVSDLPDYLSFTRTKTKYDALIKRCQNLVGLPDSDIEVLTIDQTGAYSSINRISHRRFFMYNPAFFDEVFDTTGSEFALMSISLHELAHLFYQHSLKPSASSHFKEKQADWYSGFQLAILGATLAQSLEAMEHFGEQQQTPTHPKRSDRLAEIRKGFISAKIQIFKDSTYYQLDSIINLKDRLLAFESVETKIIERDNAVNRNPASSGPTNKKAKKKYKASSVLAEPKKTFMVFYGELIYITENQEVLLYSNNETIGKLGRTGSEKFIDLQGTHFPIVNNKQILSVNPDGSRFEVGHSIQ